MSSRPNATLVDQVQRVIVDFPAEKRGDPSLQELREFYERMLKAGIVMKQRYDLPLVDTIGRSFHRPR